MTFTTHRAVLATALSLAAIPTLVAQTRTNVAWCGDSNSVDVANFAQTIATVSSAPGYSEELWSTGHFLGFAGRYYSAQMESYSFGSSRAGIGLLSLRVGPNTVRQTWSNTFAASPTDSVRMDILGANTSKQYNLGGMTLVVSGNVQANLSGSFALAWPANGAIVDGTLSSDATGRASATLVPFNVTMNNNLRFGHQQFRGRGEVWASGNSSVVRYDLDPMTLSMTASINMVFVTIGIGLVNASHAAVSIALFR
jgi:hypothetical protein